MKPSISVLVTIVFGFSSLIPLQAHHGVDEYDIDAPVKLVGKVVGTELMDPHSLLYVNVKNEDGTVTPWLIYALHYHAAGMEEHRKSWEQLQMSCRSITGFGTTLSR